MSPETYYLAALVGLILASFVIKGWRRIIPILFIGLLIPQYSSAQGYDSDDDVPTLEQIRDAIQYQQSVLQYELQQLDSGGTQTSELQDIHNSQIANGYTSAQYLSNINDKANYNHVNVFPNLVQNTSDISNALYYSSTGIPYLQYIMNYGYQTRDNVANLSPKLDDISNQLSSSGQSIGQSGVNAQIRLDDISNYSEDSLSELQDISNSINRGTTSLIDTQFANNLTTAQYLNSMNNKLGQIRNQMDEDNDVPAIQSLEALLSGYGQWDTDNDVDAIEAVEMKVDNVDDSINDLAASNTLENNNLLAALTTIMGELQDDQPDPTPQSVTAPEFNDPAEYTSAPDFNQVNQDNGNADDTTIKDTLVNDAGELYKEVPSKINFTQSINGQDSIFGSTGTQKRQPLAGSYNLPTVNGSGISAAVADIDASMQLRLSQASPVVMPLITGYLLFLIGRWTFDTSNHLIAS
jgi:hypothetical protein